MKLENEVCSLELAKKLKELGIKQESLFYWWRDNFGLESSKKQSEHIENHTPNNPQNGWDWCSAFTVGELKIMLPVLVSSYRTYQGKWFMCSIHENSPIYKKIPVVRDKIDDEFHEMKLKETGGKTEADCLAKMLIYLLENKLIEL